MALAAPETPNSSVPSSDHGMNTPNTEPSQSKIVLAGNPNVGKSVFFNAYSGRFVNVSNFPGTTVDITSSTLNSSTVLEDTPGVYGLSQMSDEEKVAEQAIMRADTVVNIVNALTLERDLFLTQQLIDYGKPLLVALNQMDEAQARGRQINVQMLSERLGVPVYPTIAIHGKGLDEVRENFNQARPGNRTPGAPPPEQLKALEENPGTRLQTYGHRRLYINQLISQVIQDTTTNGTTDGYSPKPSSIRQKLGYMLLTPLGGTVALVVALLALYQIVGVWVAGDLVGLLEEELLLTHVIPVIQSVFGSFLEESSALYQFLAGEFGLFTMSLQYIIGVIFPLVLGFYLYLSILEDCGYLPRLAVLADGVLSRIGLNGRAIIPMILGLGCVTMASVSTRMLTTNRERTIANVLLAITIPCSAQLGVIMGLMAKVGGLWGWTLYCSILVVIFALMGTVLDKVLPGKSAAFVMDLPPLRIPQLGNILKKTWIRTKSFILEAIPVFTVGSALVSILHISGLFDTIAQFIGPTIQWSLHLPTDAAQVFIMGMVRRDFGVAGLTLMADSMSTIQILTALVVITLFVPCIASASVIWKERGTVESSLILAGSWLMAFTAGAVVCRIFEWVPILPI